MRFVARFETGEEIGGRTPASSTGGALLSVEQRSQGRPPRYRPSRIAVETHESCRLGSRRRDEPLELGQGMLEYPEISWYIEFEVDLDFSLGYAVCEV